MKLDKKKRLAARALNVGLGRIAFDNSRLDEIKEAITKQDIKDLLKSKAVIIKPIKGRRKKEKRKTRKRQGKIKKRINQRKKEYVIITRKLRAYIKELRKQGRMDKEKYHKIRREIRSKKFKSKKQLKEYLEGKEK